MIIIEGDPGTPNSWCWPNQNMSESPQINPVNSTTPFFPPLTFDTRGDVREGLCPVDYEKRQHQQKLEHKASQVMIRTSGCPATDYEKCTCAYNGTVPNNRDQPLLFNLFHDPVSSCENINTVI